VELVDARRCAERYIRALQRRRHGRTSRGGALPRELVASHRAAPGPLYPLTFG
jgi:hypothetical protein